MNINMLIGFFFCVAFFHVEKANANCANYYSKIKIDVEYTDEPLVSVSLYSEVTEAHTSFKKDLNRLAISGSYAAQASLMGVASAATKISFAYDKLTEKVRQSSGYRSEKKMDTRRYQEGTKQRIRTTTTTLTLNGKSGKIIEKKIMGSTSSDVPTNFADLRNRGKRESTPTTCLIPCSAGCNLCQTCRRHKANERALIGYATNGNIDQVKRLVKKTYVDGLFIGSTALISAAFKGHRNVAKVLLAHGANPKERHDALFGEWSACDYNNKIGYIMDC
jgi:hypothetical protein